MLGIDVGTFNIFTTTLLTTKGGKELMIVILTLQMMKLTPITLCDWPKIVTSVKELACAEAPGSHACHRHTALHFLSFKK